MTLRRLFTVCLVALALSTVAQAEWTHLGNLQTINAGANGAVVRCDNGQVRISAPSADTLRIRLHPDGIDVPDSPWSVVTPADDTRLPGMVDGTQIRFNGGALSVRVNPKPCRLTVVDADGNVLLAEDHDRGMAWGPRAETGGLAHWPVRAWHRLHDKTAFFGLGEKSGKLERSDQSWSMWNTDAYAYGVNTDPLYVSIPFYLAHRDGRWHGVYFDNTWRSSFDFGRVDHDRTTFGATGGALDYYVFAGPTVKDVVHQYTALTGRMPMPPKWAIGYHQCRYSYFPEDRVRSIATTFREKQIPCDVLWYDIDYMDGYRCFTWDSARFPSPAKLNDQLHEMGFHTVAILDPGIKLDNDYAAFRSGSASDAWLKQPNGEKYVGRVWPGECVFPDYTAARAREWWAGEVAEFVKRSGLDGVWNDMNEPANFAGPNHTVPLDLVHDNNGNKAPHRACHNVYGMQMARATLNGLAQALPDRRAFTLTRANFAGGQRYAAVWTGDNRSTWSHLKMSVPMALSMGLSGMPFVGPDIGGFTPGAAAELYARWIQVGALFPFARTHASSSTPDQEPWSYGPRVEAIARESIERRYALMPYLYTLFEEAARTGTPIMRPVWMEIPEADLDHPDWTFMLGPDLYVAPIVEAAPESYSIPLPPGAWYDATTGEVHGGPRWIKVDPSLEHLPHFWRAGAIVPSQSPVQHTGMQAEEPLILDVWIDNEGEGSLYVDAGDDEVNEATDFRRWRYCLSRSNDLYDLRLFTVDGLYKESTRAPLVRFHGLNVPVKNVYVGTGLEQLLDVDADENIDTDIKSIPCKYLRQSSFWAATAVDDTVPTDSSTYHLDKARGTLAVRLESNYGEAQHVRIRTAKRPRRRLDPVVIDWTDPATGIDSWAWTNRPVHRNGGIELDVRGSGQPWIRLPRLSIDANSLSLLKLRMGVRHTRRLGLRFANQHDPAKLIGQGITIDLQPDGQVQNYTIDLRELFGNDWDGQIYLAEMFFESGSQPGELIRLERAEFSAAP